MAPRLERGRATILAHLAQHDGTQLQIAIATHLCASTVFSVLGDLHSAGLVHVCSYTKKSSSHRFVRVYRLGPGTDANLDDFDHNVAANDNTIALLKTLANRTLTREELTAATGWSRSKVCGAIRMARLKNLLHVAGKVPGTRGQASVLKYKAGPAPVITLAVQPPKPIAQRRPATAPPPPLDPLMAALFGR